MAKYQNDSMLDAALDWIKTNVKATCVLTAQPTLLSECSASTHLAVAALTTASFTLGNGDVSGRKVTIAAQTTIAVTSTGVASHVALYSTVAASSGLHYVTICTTQVLGSTLNAVTIPAWDIEIADTT